MELFRNLKIQFCKHKYNIVAEHPHCQENLWKCTLCGGYYIQHYGIGIGFKIKNPSLIDWILINKETFKYESCKNIFALNSINTEEIKIQYEICNE